MLERHMVLSGENEFSDLDMSADKKRTLELTPVSNEVALRLERLVALFLQWQSGRTIDVAGTVVTAHRRLIAINRARAVGAGVDRSRIGRWISRPRDCVRARGPGGRARSSGREYEEESRFSG
jgi:hypothetical protein